MHTETFVADALTPVRAYAALRRAAGDAASFLLESVVAGERWGRYSILGYRPRYEEVLLPSGQWIVTGARDQPARQGDPLRAAEHLFRAESRGQRDRAPAVHLARAHVGYLAWDLVHAIEKVPGWGEKVTSPLARFVGGATMVVFDNLRQTVTIAAEDRAKIEQARRDLAAARDLSPVALPDRTRIPAAVDVSMDDAAYARVVRRAKEYIAAGDAFQIVLARTFSVPAAGRDPFDAYRAMRVLNPSPYMYFLDLPPAPGETSRTQIAGASPETLVRLEDAVMTVRPLAGTRPRGATEAEDKALEEELLSDPKERAEHVMLIDLGRNDVGRVATVGSVELVAQHGDRALLARHAHRQRGARQGPRGDAPARGGARGVPRGHAVGRAEGPGHANHPRARGAPARRVRGRGRLRRRHRRPRLRHRHPHGRLQERRLRGDRGRWHRGGQRPRERGRRDVEQSARGPVRDRGGRAARRGDIEMSFQSKVVLVTGAASGIGKATALAFAREGADVVACNLNEALLASVSEELKSKGRLRLAAKVDVANRAAMASFAERVHREVGAVDVLVNNAGVGIGGGFLDTSLDDWDWILGINVKGVVHGCHFFVPGMIERGKGGQVVNVASAAGLFATPDLAAYAATKFAVVGLSEALREELRPHGIGVSTICPGIVNTPITQNMRGRGKLADPAARERIRRFYEKRGFGPERVAGAILSAARHNRDVVPVTPEAWGIYALKRLSPALLRTISRRLTPRATGN